MNTMPRAIQRENGSSTHAFDWPLSYELITCISEIMSLENILEQGDLLMAMLSYHICYGVGIHARVGTHA